GTVEVGAKLAQIGGAKAAEPAEAAPAEAVPGPATAEAAAASAAAAGAEGEAPTAAQVEEARPAAPAPSGDGAGEKTFVSPVVARIAAEHGVDVGQVPGTGRGGRVTKKDILGFIESGAPAQVPAREEPTPAARAAPAPAPAAAPTPQPGEGGESFEP